MVYVGVLWFMWVLCGLCGCSVVYVGVLWFMWVLCGLCGCSVVYVGVVWFMWDTPIPHIYIHIYIYIYTCIYKPNNNQYVCVTCNRAMPQSMSCGFRMGCFNFGSP